MQPGDVTETFADVGDLMRDIGFQPADLRLRTAFAILSRGIAATTRFEGADGPTNCSTDHVRRRRNAAVAGLARGPSKAVLAAVRGAFDISGYHAAGVGCDAVRASDRHHQRRLSLHGAGATGRDRARGRYPAGADAAGFRSGDRGGRGIRADARQRRRRAGARRRSRRPRHRGLCRRLPAGAGRSRCGPHRDLRRQPERAATEYGYISPGDVISGEVRSVAKFVEKPDPATAAGYIKAGLSLEQRQLHVSRLRSARRIPQRRCGKRAGRHRCGDQGRTRSRICHARARRIRIGEGDLDRLCGDGKDRARRGGAGGLRLVRCRLLACGVGIVGQGRPGQCRAGRRRVRGFAQLQRFDRQGAGRAGRRRRSGGGGDPGCGAGVAPEGCQRIEAAGRATEDRGAARSPRIISRCIAPGVPINRSTMANVTRSSASP